MYHFTALVTCLSILFYFFTSVRVARARAAFGIKAPTISGSPDFERVFRVQMNTLEWMPIYLPSLWLFAIYNSDAIAALVGLVWIAGRALYMTGYSQAAKSADRASYPVARLRRAPAWRTGDDRLAAHSRRLIYPVYPRERETVCDGSSPKALR